MKNIGRQWLVAGALATTLLAGCAGGAYVGTDDRDHHRHWHHEYEGRPPGYYHGGGTEVIVTPEHRY